MIKYEISRKVARITLDTPETSNKFTYQLMLDFIEALEASVNSDAVVVVLQSTGPDFSLGRDQSERFAHISRQESLSLILKANATLKQFPGVSVALIQGRCKGFGSGLALHADISIGTDDSVLGFDEIKHGLAPLLVQRYLTEYVGPKIARELIVTGRDVSAEEALRLGLLNQMVTRDALATTGDALAAQLTSYSIGALRLIHRFGMALANDQGVDSGDLAINELAQWIDAGRPDT